MTEKKVLSIFEQNLAAKMHDHGDSKPKRVNKKSNMASAFEPKEEDSPTLEKTNRRSTAAKLSTSAFESKPEEE